MKRLMERLKNELTSPQPLNTELIIGKQNTGKTTYYINLVDNYVKGGEERQIVIFSPMLDKKEVVRKKVVIVPAFYIDENVIRAIKNKVVIFDDCRLYTSSNPDEKITKAITDKLAVARHDKNDIYLIYHMFREVNPKIFTKISRVTIFQGNENIDIYKDKIVNFTEIKTAYQYVNERKDKHYCKTVNL